MVDRLEELLALLEAEDEEEQEDVLAVRLGTEVPASGIRTERMPEDSGEEMGTALDGEEGGPAEAGGLDWAPDTRGGPPERQEEGPGAGSESEAGDNAAGDGAAESLWNGLTAVSMDRNGPMALRKPGAESVEVVGAVKTAAVMEEAATAERGLERLYQQTVQASRPAAQSVPVEQAGRTARAEEPGRAAVLTVDELDRAVRRDSRRYDGGMTIF